MSQGRPLAELRGLSRKSQWELAFWAVLVVVFLVGLVRAVAQDDGELLFVAGTFFLTSSGWLVRTWWARHDASGQVACTPRALAPPRLWIAAGLLLSVGSVVLLTGPALLGIALIFTAAVGVLPLALEDRRRRWRRR